MNEQFDTKKLEIKEKLMKTRKDLLLTLPKLTDNLLHTKVSSNEGSWKVIEVLRHLYKSEKGMTDLIKIILSGGEGVPADFDLDRYNRRSVEKMEGLSLTEIKQGMEKNREQLMEVLKNCSLSDFEKKGRHASLKILSVEEIFNLIADHENTHLNSIKAVLK